MPTSNPSAGLSGDVEEAVGEDEEEVEDGDEGEVTLLGLASTSFFSFRSTCLLFVPGERRGKGERERVVSTNSVYVYIKNITKHQQNIK